MCSAYLLECVLFLLLNARPVSGGRSVDLTRLCTVSPDVRTAVVVCCTSDACFCLPVLTPARPTTRVPIQSSDGGGICSRSASAAASSVSRAPPFGADSGSGWPARSALSVSVFRVHLPTRRAGTTKRVCCCTMPRRRSVGQKAVRAVFIILQNSSDDFNDTADGELRCHSGYRYYPSHGSILSF